MESVDIISEFFEFMGTDKLLNMVKLNLKAFTRNCKLTPKDIVCFMLTCGF